MTLNLIPPTISHTDFTPRITVIGVGGGGTNAVNNMIALNLQGVEFVVANTDAQQLTHSKADRRIQLGPHLTEGLGAGAKPEIGRAAAEEAADELDRHLSGSHMVFITAGMGGGTGTGAAPVIARMARERGILTVGVVTKPFGFEGGRRQKAAEAGIAELQQYVDTLIVIPNQNLFRMANERTTWKDAFQMADQVLYMGVRGVTDLMMVHGLVNLDFADIRTVMAEMGKAMMGTGEAEGENRAIRAAESAINNPLLEDTSMSGARGLLINITGGDDLTLFEVDQAANRIREEVDEEANVIFGSAVDESLTGRIRVSVVATGIDSPRGERQRPPLTVVNGGGMPSPQPIAPHGVSHGGDSDDHESAQPLMATMTVGNTVRQIMPQPIVTPRMQQVAEQEVETQQPATQFTQQPQVQQPQTLQLRTHAQPQQPQQPPPRGELFTETLRPATTPPVSTPVTPSANEPVGNKLFKAVTGVFRRSAGQAPAAPVAPQTERRAPTMTPVVSETQAAPAPQAQTNSDVGIEIPAFLRRQSS